MGGVRNTLKRYVVIGLGILVYMLSAVKKTFIKGEMRPTQKKICAIGFGVLMFILVCVWGQYSATYKVWFLKHTLGSFPPSIVIHEVYGSAWEMDYWYIFELRHTKDAIKDILKYGFFWGGDPGPEHVRKLVEAGTAVSLDPSWQWELFKRETQDVKMYYLVPSQKIPPGPLMTSYLYVYTL